MSNWYSSLHFQSEPDSILVAATAGLLDIPEYRVFQLAYHDWYGKEADEVEMGIWFDDYMYEDQVPFWVRGYCKKVQRRSRQGTLSRDELGIKPISRPPRFLRWFVTSIVVSILVLTVLVFLAEQTANLLPFLKECYFPPCY